MYIMFFNTILFIALGVLPNGACYIVVVVVLGSGDSSGGSSGSKSWW